MCTSFRGSPIWAWNSPRVTTSRLCACRLRIYGGTGRPSLHGIDRMSAPRPCGCLDAGGPDRNQDGQNTGRCASGVSGRRPAGRLRLRRLLRALRPGRAYELMCHPGLTPEEPDVKRWQYGHEKELHALTNPAIRSEITARGIHLCNFKDLMTLVKIPISALPFISLSLRRTGSTPHSARLFAFANVTLPARTCCCLFGRRPKIQATRAASNLSGARIELGRFLLRS